jgi:hypothetical protein
MLSFVQRFTSKIAGVLHGFDRLRFRGTKRLLATANGLWHYLCQQHIPLPNFQNYAATLTKEVRQAAEAVATEQQRPVQYLAGYVDKEDLVQAIACRDSIQRGLICVLKAVETCRSYEIHRNRDKKRLELRNVPSRCLHYYHYFQDADLGLCHVRLQTWFPFSVQICCNGRDWLARQMDREGLGYHRRDNCFIAIENWERAQQLAEEQLRTDWPTLLSRLTEAANPALARIFADKPTVPYYWSLEESEWASDVVFRQAADLKELAPRLYRHGLFCLGSRDVMRFLGRRLDTPGERFGRFAAEVVSDLKQRPEGIRIKHRLGRNWIKMYDKQGSVLRVETVINDPRQMKAYRPKEGDEDGPKEWRKLRKGVADVHRRAEISQASNERYLDAMTKVEDPTPLAELADTVCQPVTWHGQRHRALNPLAADDAALFEAVHRGEFFVNGFRNRDLATLLFSGQPANDQEQRRRSAVITRKLRLLRAHGLIQKVPKTHRYQISVKGRTALPAFLAARQADLTKLTTAA